MKVQKISQFQHYLAFNFLENNFEAFQTRFLQSDLGKIYQSIPWQELVNVLKIRKHRKGPNSIFNPQGKIALMILKHYADVSDRKLIEQLNGNIEYQYFCDIYLGSNRIENYKIVSQIRTELSAQLDIEQLQKFLYNYWSDYIENPSHIVMDATCYESDLCRPANQKLLWESVDWLYEEMKLICKTLKIRLPRTKYDKCKGRYLSYSKMRKKTNKRKTPLTRSLLHLFNKLNGILDEIEKKHKNEIEFPEKYYKRQTTIKIIYQQQKELFETGKLPKNRIVSISKDYIRPIVRGKVC